MTRNSRPGAYLVYPHYRHHPEILKPLEHTTVRVKVELAEAVPDGMLGTLHLAWYDPDNTPGNEPSTPPTHNGHGRRDNAEDVELLDESFVSKVRGIRLYIKTHWPMLPTSLPP